jgi:hypothetical protein
MSELISSEGELQGPIMEFNDEFDIDKAMETIKEADDEFSSHL